MARTWKFLNWSLLLVVTLFAASCADRNEPLGFGRPQLDVDVHPYKSLSAPGHSDVTVSAVIGANGGVLIAPAANDGARSFGYALTVSKGTVSQPTTFTMRIVGGNQYVVDLTATQTDADGNEVDVGGQLQQKVYLAISYRDSPAPPRRGSKVVILFVPEDGSTPVPVPTYYNTHTKYILGELSHFSRYTAAWN